MIISRQTQLLSRPTAGERISANSLAYLSTRSKLAVFNLVIKHFRKSGITQAELAKRLGKGTDRISKMLGAPGNWTIDTAAHLLFAIDGGILAPSAVYPLDRPRRNDTHPHFLNSETNAPTFKLSTSALGYSPPPPNSSTTASKAIIRSSEFS